MDNISDAKFYIVINREKRGPFSIDELKTMNITPKTKVWCKGMTNWDDAENVYSLKDIIVDVPTTPYIEESKPQMGAVPPVYQNESTEQYHNSNN